MSESNSSAFKIHPASFRDPSGFIFQSGDVLYRQVNQRFREHYDLFISSGLYATLTAKKLLIPHREIKTDQNNTSEQYKVLQPERIAFISYPYEWCFAMLKDAALLTLQLAKTALEHGMILKDATPYNIQWHENRLVLIDTLSFEKYGEGKPWIAYRQFCECFLGPLLLMHFRKTSLHTLQLAYPQGIPLQVIKKLLPWKSRLSMLTYLHIHLHGKIAAGNKPQKDREAKLPKKKLLNLLTSLEMLTRSLQLENKDSAWGDYYEEAALRDDYLAQKKKIISNWLDNLTGLKTGIDLGANTGEFSFLLSSKGIRTVAVDGDPVAIAKLYQHIKTGKYPHTIPLIMDLGNPSPASGLNYKEHASFGDRTKDTDVGLCLALIHHLCLGGNIPFHAIAEWLYATCKTLIIEFVPKTDPKSQQVLANRNDIYDSYSEPMFAEVFGQYFTIRAKQQIPGTERILFLMDRH